MTNRRQFLRYTGAAALSASLLHSMRATAQSMDIAKILTGFPAGGTVDALARRLADRLRGNYANTVVVENKPGAAGQLGVIALKDSPADGSVMLITPSSMLSIYPYTYPKLQYKLDDVAPISNGAYINHAIAVGPGVPDSVKSLKDFLAWAKVNGDKANFGSPGAGSMPHLIGILLNRATGVELRHIPYRGSVPGVQDLLGGQISSFCGPIGDYLPHAKAGKLRVLAVSGNERSRFATDVPTLKESGHPITVREWYGFFMPGKAKPETLRRASTALVAALAHPDVATSANAFGLDIQSSSPAALADLLKADAEEWQRIIKQIGFTAES